jgi:hypothetical protein
MQMWCASFWHKGQNVKQYFIGGTKESVEQEVRDSLSHMPEFQKIVKIKVKHDHS